MGDNLNSLQLRTFVTKAYFTLISAIITAASLLPFAFPFPSNFQLQPQSLVVIWESSFPWLWDCPQHEVTSSPSLLSCPFPLSQIFLQPCLIGALLSLAFFGLPPCQSNAIRPGAGANPLLWLLLLPNPRPKIPQEPMEWENPGPRGEGERAKQPDCRGEGASI